MTVGSLVTCTADGRFPKAVYRFEGQSFGRTIVRHVGDAVDGRVEWRDWREQPVTHRCTATLVAYPPVAAG